VTNVDYYYYNSYAKLPLKLHKKMKLCETMTTKHHAEFRETSLK